MGVRHPQVGGEFVLEAMDIVVATLTPTIAHGVEYVLDFTLANVWFGVMDFAHSTRSSGTATTKRPPQ